MHSRVMSWCCANARNSRTLLGEPELDAPDDEATLVRTLVADDIDRRLLQGRGLLKREQLRIARELGVEVMPEVGKGEDAQLGDHHVAG